MAQLYRLDHVSRRSSFARLFGATLICLALGALVAAPAPAAPTWLSPLDVSTGGDGNHPAVSLDAAGDATAVWSSFAGSTEVIQAATRPAGGAWGAPVELSVPAQSTVDPQVAVDPAGDATAVWERYNGSHLVIQGASRPADGAWSPPVDLSAVDEEGGQEVRLAVDASGGATAVWVGYDASGAHIRSASRPRDGAWSPPVDLSLAGQNVGRPRVAIDAVGDATAVWQLNGQHVVIEAATRPALGAWSPPVAISNEAQNATGAQVAVDPTGDAIAAWYRYDSPKSVIQASTRPAAGAWSPPVDLTTGEKNAYGPQLGLDAAGNATAIWNLYVGSEAVVVQAATQPAGGAWSAPVDLSVAQENGEEDPRLAVDPAGDAVAAWGRYDGTSLTVQAAARPAGGAWGAPTDLSAPGKLASRTRLAIDSDGDAIAVWRLADGINEVIQADGYDAAGPQLRSLSIPADATAGAPVAFSVSPLDVFSGQGATSWDFGDGGSATGTAPSHVYASPGTFTVTVGSGDALGNSSSAVGTIKVAAAPPPTNSPSAPAATPAPLPATKPNARAARVAIVKGGTVLLQLTCPPSGPDCGGTAELSLKLPQKPPGGNRLALAGARKRSVLIGKARFDLAAGKRKTVPIKLNAKGRARLAAAPKKGVTVALSGGGLSAGQLLLKTARRR